MLSSNITSQNGAFEEDVDSGNLRDALDPSASKSSVPTRASQGQLGMGQLLPARTSFGQATSSLRLRSELA